MALANGTSTLKITTEFADESKRDLSIGPLAAITADEDKAALKAKLKNFDMSAIEDIYVSDDGESSTAIVGATLTTTAETEINLNDD